MGLKKFRKTRVQDEEYINVSMVCNNYDRANHEIRNPNSIIDSYADYLINPLRAQINTIGIGVLD